MVPSNIREHSSPHKLVSITGKLPRLSYRERERERERKKERTIDKVRESERGGERKQRVLSISKQKGSGSLRPK